jgi:hypothetical protein
MVFEIAGFFLGSLLIGAALMLLHRHESGRVFHSFYQGKAASRRGGNALIWPSR